MPRLATSTASSRRSSSWRAFDARDGRQIDEQLAQGRRPCCPACNAALEARPDTRVPCCRVLDATGYDLECRRCRRFRTVVRHTERSLHLVRMRRLVAAVTAVGESPRGRAAVMAAADQALVLA
jgi:hypothetical protein